MKLFLGSLMLSLLAIAMSARGEEHSHKHEHEHAHDQFEVSSSTVIPSLSLEALRDETEGWNLHLITKNFRFSPENINKDPIPGKGHAHLYVDGKKMARLYGAWFHLRDLPPGRHVIRVTLNANNHADLVLQGHQIAATKELVQ